MNKLFFNKVTILGVGLIGSSFALALKKSRLCNFICGYGRNEDNLARAKERGIIDEYSLDLKKVCSDSDFILFSAPVGVFKSIAEQIKDSIKKGALITDAGSVKGSLVYELEALMKDEVYYVGSHPIAGSDKSGIDDAREDLFVNARCIITPTENTNEVAKEKVISIWEAIGAKVELMDPFKHDKIYAAVSHFPHIAAYAIVKTIGEIDSGFIDYAGKGFRDTTRIAMSSPEIWRDISVYNKDNLINLLKIFADNIRKMEDMLQAKDANAIERFFSESRDLRKKIEN